jgi:cytochrome oxidase Cu insertion factor (SCO1/SenC/PrrC family)
VKRLLLITGLFTAAASVWAQAPAPAAAKKPMSSTLQVGDTAPDFTLPSTQGGKVTLSELRGKKSVVLAFFPAAFTGG